MKRKLLLGIVAFLLASSTVFAGWDLGSEQLIMGLPVLFTSGLCTATIAIGFVRM